MIVVCPECGVNDSVVLETRQIESGERRRHECACGIRWTSRALIERGSITNATRSGYKRRYDATGSVQRPKPPPTGSVTPPTGSVGGVGGGLPSVQGVLQPLSSDLDSNSALLGKPRARARTKPEAKEPGPFTAMRDAFVAAWEEHYDDKYPFEVKDGTALAGMIRKHSHLVERWPEMIGWYFSDSFWGNKRHPLVGLATNPAQFSGSPSNGIPVKVAVSRETTRNWATRAK